MPTATSATAVNNTTIQYQNDDGSNTTLQGGTRAWRDNNPGNMTYNRTTVGLGAIGEDAYGMAIFPSYQAGHDALMNDLHSVYGNSTINDMMQHYAPPGSNNTAAYSAFLNDRVGASGDTTVNNLTQDQFNRLMNGIEQMEGWRPGSITGADDNMGGPAPLTPLPGSSSNNSDDVEPSYQVADSGQIMIDAIDQNTETNTGTISLNPDGSYSDYDASGNLIITATDEPDDTTLLNIFQLSGGMSSFSASYTGPDGSGQVDEETVGYTGGSTEELLFDPNTGTMTETDSTTSSGSVVTDYSANGTPYNVANYNTVDVLQSQTITNSDGSQQEWFFNTANPSVYSYVVNLNPQGQETWQYDWNASAGTPFTAFQWNTAGSGDWSLKETNFDSTMQAQSAVTDLTNGDWNETWWNPGTADWTSYTEQYQSGTGNWEWQLIGYAPGNSLYYVNDLSGDTNPANWSYMAYERDSNNDITTAGTVD